MGCQECEYCSELLDGCESFFCECCGGDSILCDDCSTKGGTCDQGRIHVCLLWAGCGDDCAAKHVTKKLSCGHEGCNFHESGCLICKNENDAKVETDAVKDDIGTIKSIRGKIESTSVKAALESIIADQDGKKRKRNDD